MADSKITALASIGTGTDPANDPLVIVDVSDILPGGMSLTGTTKKVTLNNLLACSPTATLASATITGDLTVDTSTLYVSSSADKVGIGTTSLSNEKLTVAGNISANAWLGRSNISAPAGDCSIFRSADNTLGFGIASTTAMTLNATGLGVGGSPAQKLDVNGALLSTNIYLRSDDSDVSWGAGVGSRPIIRGNQTNNTIKFYTASTDRMTLDASGRLLVNTASVIGGSGDTLQIAGKTTAGTDYCSMYTGTSTTVYGARYYHTSAVVGSITFTALGTAYNIASDYRLKEAVAPLTGCLARVSALKPSIYKWKVNGSDGEGFIAHELAEVIPAAVTGQKDAVNEDGSIQPQQVDLSKIVPVLVAAIQELTARVQTLETR